MNALARQRGRAALPPIMTRNDDMGIRLAPFGAAFALTVVLAKHAARPDEAVR